MSRPSIERLCVVQRCASFARRPSNSEREQTQLGRPIVASRVVTESDSRSLSSQPGPRLCSCPTPLHASVAMSLPVITVDVDYNAEKGASPLLERVSSS